ANRRQCASGARASDQDGRVSTRRVHPLHARIPDKWRGRVDGLAPPTPDPHGCCDHLPRRTATHRVAGRSIADHPPSKPSHTPPSCHENPLVSAFPTENHVRINPSMVFVNQSGARSARTSTGLATDSGLTENTCCP